MAKKTLQDRIAAALIARGESQLTKTTKALVFTRKEYDGYFYVGKMGSLRYGPNYTASIAMSDVFKKKLLDSQPG